MAAEDLEFERKFDVIIISETLNFAADVQQIFERVHAVSHAGTRLILNFHSGLWRPLVVARQPARRARGTSALQLAQLHRRAQHARPGRLGSDPTTRTIASAVPCFGLEKIVNRYARAGSVAAWPDRFSGGASDPVLVRRKIRFGHHSGTERSRQYRSCRAAIAASRRGTQKSFSSKETPPITPGRKSSACRRRIPISTSERCSKAGQRQRQRCARRFCGRDVARF